MPMSYFTGAFDEQLTNDAGVDYSATDSIARPALMQTGGRDRRRQRTQRKRSQRHRARGGFYPSVMGPFIANASRVAVPLAAVAASHYLGAPNYFGTRKAKAGKKLHRTHKRKAGRR